MAEPLNINLMIYILFLFRFEPIHMLILILTKLTTDILKRGEFSFVRVYFKQ